MNKILYRCYVHPWWKLLIQKWRTLDWIILYILFSVIYTQYKYIFIAISFSNKYIMCRSNLFVNVTQIKTQTCVFIVIYVVNCWKTVVNCCEANKTYNYAFEGMKIAFISLLKGGSKCFCNILKTSSSMNLLLWSGNKWVSFYSTLSKSAHISVEEAWFSLHLLLI